MISVILYRQVINSFRTHSMQSKLEHAFLEIRPSLAALMPAYAPQFLARHLFYFCFWQLLAVQILIGHTVLKPAYRYLQDVSKR